MKIDIEQQAENACEWIERLASNDYPPTVGKLHSPASVYNSGFCCLGVAREVVNGPEEDGDGSLTESAKSFGLKEHKQYYLARLNDKGVEHSVIAASLIEYAGRFFSPAVAKRVKEYFRDNVSND